MELIFVFYKKRLVKDMALVIDAAHGADFLFHGSASGAQ